jgi:hypothetical protein
LGEPANNRSDHDFDTNNTYYCRIVLFRIFFHLFMQKQRFLKLRSELKGSLFRPYNDSPTLFCEQPKPKQPARDGSITLEREVESPSMPSPGKALTQRLIQIE